MGTIKYLIIPPTQLIAKEEFTPTSKAQRKPSGADDT